MNFLCIFQPTLLLPSTLLFQSKWNITDKEETLNRIVAKIELNEPNILALLGKSV